MANVLDNPIEPVNDANFFNCLDTASEKSQLLAKSMTDITTSLKKEDRDTFKGAVDEASEAVCALTESAAQVCFVCCMLLRSLRDGPGRSLMQFELAVCHL